MTSAKDIINNSAAQPSWWKWFQQTTVSYAGIGMDWGRWAYMNSRFIGWYIITTGIVTIIPLLIEIKREVQYEELEKLQMNALLAEGATPHELAQNGLTSAVQPKVLE